MMKNSISGFYSFARYLVSGETRYGIGFMYRKGNGLKEKAKHKKGIMRLAYNAAGFTLVELSIVLVIVGLLIGGILVAQSMMETAKISSQVSQIQQFDAGVMNFKTMFNHLPGDSPYHGGNGNGVVTRSTTSVGVNRYQGEMTNFWNNLDSEQFPKYYEELDPVRKINLEGADRNTPAAKMGSSRSFFLASAISTNGEVGEYADMINKENYYVHLSSRQLTKINDDCCQFAPTHPTNSAAKPSELMALDIKMDDGLANSGYVISGSLNGTGSRGAVKLPHPECSTAVDYNLDYSDYSCTPLIRIGGQAGNPQ